MVRLYIYTSIHLYIYTSIHLYIYTSIYRKHPRRHQEGPEVTNFISITPRQLVEKEGSEQKAVKVNMFTGVQHSRWNLLAAKEDFRTNNSQYLLQTGFLGEDLNADNVYLSLNLVPEDSVGDPDHSSVEVETSLHMNMEAVVEFSDHLESGQNNSTRSERSGLSLSSRSAVSTSSLLLSVSAGHLAGS